MEELQKNENNSKIEELKQIVSSFVDFLEHENSALRDFDTASVSAAYEQKTKLVSAYRSISAYFIKNHQILEQLDNDDKVLLRDLSLSLDAQLKENEMLLKTRMEASKTVMDTIISVAKMNNNRNATSYGSQGTYSPLDNNKNALAINRTL